jgi:hypothetical protein
VRGFRVWAYKHQHAAGTLLTLLLLTLLLLTLLLLSASCCL